MLPSSRSRFILLVEPSSSSQPKLADAMASVGLSSVVANTVDAALKQVQAGPDVLITELDLGGEITGWQLANVFRANDPTIGVIYTSSDTSNISQRVAGGLFFPKPYNVRDVVDGCRLLLLEKEEFKARFN